MEERWSLIMCKEGLKIGFVVTELEVCWEQRSLNQNYGKKKN